MVQITGSLELNAPPESGMGQAPSPARFPRRWQFGETVREAILSRL